MSHNEQLFYTAAVDFEAARQLSSYSAGHRLRRLHGHSFLATVRAALPEGWAAFPGDEVETLRSRLVTVTAPLDYQHLNAVLDQPTDQNLARWLRKELELGGIRGVGVQSTQHSGADLDQTDHAHIWRRYAFQAAHRLPHVAAEHKCGRMHGHGFEVIVHADQSVQGSSFGIDYDYLDQLWVPLHATLHHTCLNDIPGLENPTSELISSWIWQRLQPQLHGLSSVTVYETASCGAHFDGSRYRIWKEMTLDSALRLKRAPESDPRRRIHGHTYTLRLHLQGELDALMGWTRDFGDIKEKFEPMFRRLDHQPLHEAVGLEDNDLATLTRWIRREAASSLPELERIDLFEARGCGAILTWGAAEPAVMRP